MRPPDPTRTRPRAALLAALLAAAAPGCGGSDDGSQPLHPALATPAPARGPRAPRPADAVDPKTGLNAADRAAFHHLAVGSEVLPLAFLMALDDPATGRPFLDDPARFGLIPDPEPNPDLPVRLPLGLSVARSRDLRLANVAMVGLTCAACHVGALEFQGKPVALIEGAPNTFDLHAFNHALASAIRATASDPSAAWAFLGRVYRVYRYTPSPPGASNGPAGGGGGGGGAAGKGAAAKGKGQGQGQGKGFAKKGGGGAGKAAAKGQPASPPSAAAKREAARPAPLLLFATSPQELALFAAPPSTDRSQMFEGALASLTVRYPSLDDLQAAGPVPRALAEALQRLHREELARPAPDPARGLAFASASAEGVLAEYARALDRGNDRVLATLGPELTDASAAFRRAWLGDLPRPDVTLPPAGDGPAVPGLATADPAAVNDLLADFVETVRLLRARAELLERSGDGNPAPAAAPGPGPGRSEPVGRTRALLFPKEPADAPAPVSPPDLWGARGAVWFLWDASVSSPLGRDVGHALAGTTVPVGGDSASTLIAPNLERLGRIVAGLRPPRWPEDAFGKIDPTTYQRGSELFRQKCADCHDDATDSETPPERLFTPEEVGTDPTRARQAARPVGTLPAHDALAGAVRAAVAKAGGASPPAEAWRSTGKYAARPLLSVWATSPYLHNGSVPTLYHLLLPEDQRPKTFPVGHREYDPKRLGYALDNAGGARGTFDTSLPGNSNRGHSGPRFGTDLSEADRDALLEYLKAGNRK